MEKIAAVVITRNEETRIRRALASVRGFADEIIVVDDNSTDQTRAIAEKEFGAKVFVRPLAGDFAAQRNFGAGQASNVWILWMDADEEVPAATAAALRGADLEHCNGVSLCRLNHFCGIPLRYCAGGGRERAVRLYRKSAGSLQGALHEQVALTGAVLDLEASLWHHPAETCAAILLKGLAYTEVEAEAYCAARQTISERELRYQLTWKSLKRFWKLYVKCHGYKDGTAGLVWCLINVIGPMTRWMKIWEKAQRGRKLVP